MLKNDLLSIKKFLKNDLSSIDKNYRKKIANSIESKIRFLLDKNNIFLGFKLSRSYTNSLNNYLKKENERVAINIKLSKNNTFIEVIVFSPLFYFVEEKYPIKIHKKLINNLKNKYEISQINEAGEYFVVLFSEQIPIDDNIEIGLEKTLTKLSQNLKKFNNELNNVTSKINENDIFYFDNDIEFNISNDEFLDICYQISSIDIDIDELNNELFSLLNKFNGKEKERLILIIAHLNLPLIKKFIGIDREFLTIEEKVKFDRQIITNFFKSINKHDSNISKFSTYSYYWLSQAASRSIVKIVKNRMLTMYGVMPSTSILNKFRVEYKKANNEYAGFNQLLEFANLESKIILKNKKAKENKIKKDKISKSAIFKLIEIILNKKIFNLKELEKIGSQIHRISEICLTGKEKFIFQKRYFPKSDDSLPRMMSLQDIGDEYGLTRERIRQIEREATKKVSVAYKKFPDSKKINRSWLEPIFKKESKRGIGKYYAALDKKEIFFMGQIKNLSISEFIEIYDDNYKNKEIIESFYYQIIPFKTLKNKYKDLKIEALNLSNRSLNGLKNENIEFISQIDINELNNIPNLGRKSLNEIRSKVIKFNE